MALGSLGPRTILPGRMALVLTVTQFGKLLVLTKVAGIARTLYG